MTAATPNTDSSSAAGPDHGGAERIRTLLVVAGEFPPVKTIGRIRAVKFVEHLRNHGWRSVALTIEPRPGDPNNVPALNREIPDHAEVHRVPWPDWEANVVGAVKRLLGRKPPVGSAPRTADTTPSVGCAPRTADTKPPVGCATRTKNPESIRRRLIDVPLAAFKWLLRHVVFIPDDYLPWAIRASREALRICREQHFDVVYTTLPPFSAALVGYRVKRKLGIPWVVDYRDLWYGDVLREWVGPLRKRLELWLERHLMRRADVIIGVSEQKTAFLRQLLPRSNARFETLTNGYDPEIYEPFLREPRQGDDTIDFVFTGRLFKNRRGYAFAEALGQLAQEQPELKDKVRVHFLGGVAPEIRQRYEEILSQYDIAKVFRFAGDVPYEEAMRAQVNADYLLLIVDTGKTSSGVIPGKLFEYVASRRPIFALCDPGATQEIIERARIGVVVPVESVERSRDALQVTLSRPVPEELQSDAPYLTQFERKAISAAFAHILEDLVRAP